MEGYKDDDTNEQHIDTRAEFKEMQFINYQQCSSEYPSLNQTLNTTYVQVTKKVVLATNTRSDKRNPCPRQDGRMIGQVMKQKL
jgi:hypothetical protein